MDENTKMHMYNLAQNLGERTYIEGMFVPYCPLKMHTLIVGILLNSNKNAYSVQSLHSKTFINNILYDYSVLYFNREDFENDSMLELLYKSEIFLDKYSFLHSLKDNNQKLLLEKEKN